MSKVISAVLPIAGAVLGSLVLPGVGTAAGIDIGAGAGGAIGGALGGLGSGLVSGGGWKSDLLGATLGGVGGYFGGSSLGALGSGGAAGPASILSNASDPIQAISNAMTATGTDTATDAAQALGYSNTNAMLMAGNPAWLGAGEALQGGVSNATGGVLGNGANVGSFTGTAGATGNAGSLASMLKLAGGGSIGAGTAGGASGLGTLSSLLSLGSGAYGLSNAIQMQQLAKQAGASTQYAPQYAAQLAALEANPSSITSTPGYQSGLEAVERSMAAQGYQGSGNMAAALQQYGGNFFNQQVQQLQSLANPSGAGTALSGAAASNTAASSALAALGYGAAGLGF